MRNTLTVFVVCLISNSCCVPLGARVANLQEKDVTPRDVIAVLGPPTTVTRSNGRIAPVYWPNKKTAWYSGEFDTYYWQNPCDPEDYMTYYFLGDRFLNISAPAGN